VELLVCDVASAVQLALLLDGGGPGARGDHVIAGHGAGGEGVGLGHRLAVAALAVALAASAASEVGALAGLRGAEGQVRPGRAVGVSGRGAWTGRPWRGRCAGR